MEAFPSHNAKNIIYLPVHIIVLVFSLNIVLPARLYMSKTIHSCTKTDIDQLRLESTTQTCSEQWPC
jgi:hypothetical protein